MPRNEPADAFQVRALQSHWNAPDPHGQYVLEADLDALIAAYAAANPGVFVPDLAAYQTRVQKGAPRGYAGLDDSGKVPVSQMQAELAAIEGLTTAGLAVRTAEDTWTTRSVAVGTGLAVTNADGVVGNPTVAFAAGFGPVTGLTATRIPYASSSSVLADSANLAWDVANSALRIGPGSAASPALVTVGDTDTGLLWPSANILSVALAGVERYILRSGTNSPFTVNHNATAYSSLLQPNINGHWVVTLDGGTGGGTWDCYGSANGVVLTGRTAGGTGAVPTAVTVDQILVNLSGRGGFSNAGTMTFTGDRAGIRARAAEAYTSSNQGTYLQLYATAIGASAASIPVRIDAALVTLSDAVNVAVGTTTGTKIGTATTQKIGFWNKAPVAQPAVPTFAAITTVAVAGVVYTAAEQAMLGTLKADVIALRASIVALCNRFDQSAAAPGLLSGTGA